MPVVLPQLAVGLRDALEPGVEMLKLTRETLDRNVVLGQLGLAVVTFVIVLEPFLELVEKGFFLL